MAKGEFIAFVDADTVSIHPETFDAIERLLDSGRCVGGATGVGLERWSAGLAVVYAMCLPLVWLTGMDTGVVFCRREDYVAVGGYDESRPVAEDVAFLLALRRLGKSRGQRLVRAPERGNTGPEVLIYLGVVAAVNGLIWIRKKRKK